MQTLIVKSYPDGTATVTKKRQNVRIIGPKTCRWDERGAARRGAIASLGALEVASLLGIELGVGGEPPLSCQESQKSAKRQTPLRMGLTDRGQKMLRRVFASWETVITPGTVAFGTLTLSDYALSSVLSTGQSTPGEVYQQCLSYFMERLRKLLKSRGLPGDVIWVTEIHPSRSQRMGVCIPHVHFVCQTAEKKYQWLVKPSEIEELWATAINAYVNVEEKNDLRSRCEIKCVKKSVAKYVSKYLSKSKYNAIVNTPNLNTELIPKRWYAVANALHALLRRMTSVISGEEAQHIFDWLRSEGNPVVKRWGDITIPGEAGRAVWVSSWFILHCAVDSDGMRLLAFDSA